MSYTKLGFISHLPIDEDDKVIVFFCAKINKRFPVGQFEPDDFLVPISLPLIGEYDGYGNIKNYDKKIGEYIYENFGVNAKNLISSMQFPNNFNSVEESKKNLNKFYTFSKDADLLREKFSDSFDNSVYYTLACSKIYETYKNCYISDDDFSITYTMERLDVYEKIISMMYNENNYKRFIEFSYFLSKNKEYISFNILNVNNFTYSINPIIDNNILEKLCNDELNPNEKLKFFEKDNKAKELGLYIRNNFKDCNDFLCIRSRFSFLIYENYLKFDIHELGLDEYVYNLIQFIRFMDMNRIFFSDSYGGYQFISDYNFKNKKELLKFCIKKLEEYDN